MIVCSFIHYAILYSKNTQTPCYYSRIVSSRLFPAELDSTLGTSQTLDDRLATAHIKQ